MPVTPLVRTEPLRTNVQFYLFVAPNTTNSVLWTHPNVTTQARVRIDGVNLDKPIPAYGNYTTYVGNYYAKGNAINIAKRMADFFEYQGLQKGFGDIGGGLYGGAIFMQNFGTTASGKSLFYSASDAITYNGTTFYGGFHANSTAQGTQYTIDNASLTTSLRPYDFMLCCMQQLKVECDRRNLCYPAYYSDDFEEKIGPSNLLGAGNSVTQIGAGLTMSYWKALMTDSRFGEETVYENFENGSWKPKTFYDAWVAAGSPNDICKDGNGDNVYWFQGINREWAKAMYPYLLRIADHAAYKAVYSAVNAVFPLTKCGNYDIQHPISNIASDFYPDSRDIWLRYPNTDTKFERQRYLRASFQSPVCYSPKMSSGAWNADSFAAASEVYDSGNAAFYTKHPFASGYVNQSSTVWKPVMYRQVNTQRIKSCTANKNPLETIPYIEAPLEDAAANDYGVGAITHNVTVQQLYDFISSIQSIYGLKKFFVYNPSYLDLNNTSATANFISFLNKFYTTTAVTSVAEISGEG